VAFNDDRLAISASFDRTVKVWRLYEQDKASNSIAIEAEAATDTSVATLTEHHDWVMCCEPYNNSEKVLTCSYDGSLKTFDLQTLASSQPAACLSTMQASSQVYCCQEFSDGRAAVSGEHNGIVSVWDLRTGEQSARTQPEQRFKSKCALAPKSDEPVDRDEPNTAHMIEREACPPHTQLVAWSCDVFDHGRKVLVGTGDGALTIWDLRTGGCVKTWHAHNGAVYSCRVLGGGARTVSTGSDSSIKIWGCSCV
jgi:WD40 repeat protein